MSAPSDILEEELLKDPELDQGSGNLDLDLFSNTDWMNVDIDSILDSPDLTNEPYPHSDKEASVLPDGLTIRRAKARAKSPSTIGSDPATVSDLNDFSSPAESPRLPPLANAVDQNLIHYGNPMDCGDMVEEQHLGEYAMPSQERPSFQFEHSAILPPSSSRMHHIQSWSREPILTSRLNDNSDYRHRADNPDFASKTSSLQTGAGFTSIYQGAYSLPYYNDGPRTIDQRLEITQHTQGMCESRNLPLDFDSDSDSSDFEITPVATHTSVYFQRQPAHGTSKSRSGEHPKLPRKPYQPTFKSRQLTKGNPRYHPNEAYEPLRQIPKPWGPFQYTGDGELEPSDLFTAEEITQYLFEHPLHQESKTKRKSKLVLRIHSNPPDSAKRFPTNHGSHRCRFQECPTQNNTINQGMYAVIFDELSADHPNHDPFLNAGWVHLYCLERFCNFPKICRRLNVQSEKRTFPREGSKNKGNNCMRLDKVRGVEELVEKFVKVCRQGISPPQYPQFDLRDRQGQPYENTLCHRLCLQKQQGQPSAVNRQEAAREQAAGRTGATLKHHLGNLVIEAPIRQTTRSHKNQNQLIANPRQRRIYKHGMIGNDESEDDARTDSAHGDDDEDGNEEPQEYEERHIAPIAKMQSSTPQYQTQHRAEMPGERQNSKKRSWIVVDSDDEDEVVLVSKRHRTQTPMEDASKSATRHGRDTVPSTPSLDWNSSTRRRMR